jgi:nucleoside-diphosphate-sugar epimerase
VPVTGIETLIITGSNGFVGQSLLGFILKLDISKRPKRIITLNRTDQSKEILKKYSSLNIEYRIVDLAQPWTFEIQNAHLINLAADGSKNAYSEDASHLFTTIGAQCAEWIRQNKPSKVFHASSGATYGILPLVSNNFNEDIGKLSTKENFINSRMTVENSLINVADELNGGIIIGRLFSFIGPNILSKTQYAISSFIHGAVEKKKISINGNPNTVRSYLHESDMSEWILKSFEIGSQSDTIAIGSSNKVSIAELAEFIAITTGAEVEYLNPNAAGDIYIADNARTLERLGVSETKNWQDGVLECIEIAKGNKN